MSTETWRAWRAAAIEAHARDMVDRGHWPAEGAEDRSTKEMESLMPDGQATPGHSVFSIVSDQGLTVGSVWVATEARTGNGSLFIWDLLIHPGFRGQCFGRATMEALEPFARAVDCTTIQLHVFGSNEVARNLYRSSGYTETDIVMLKSVG